MSRDSPPHIKAANQEEGKSFYLSTLRTIWHDRWQHTACPPPPSFTLPLSVPLFFPQRSQKKSATRIMRRVREMKRSRFEAGAKERRISTMENTFDRIILSSFARLIIAFDSETKNNSRDIIALEIVFYCQSSELSFEKAEKFVKS